MIGTLLLKELKVDCFCGVYEHEKREKQTLLLDITIKTDFTKAIATDQIEECLDYDKVALLCQKVIHLRHYHLLENLAHTLLQALFEAFSPLALRIEVKKELGFTNASVVLQKGEV